MFRCPGKKSEVFSDEQSYIEHIKTCFFVSIAPKVFLCRFESLHMFRSRKDKADHETRCLYRERFAPDPKLEEIDNPFCQKHVQGKPMKFLRKTDAKVKVETHKPLFVTPEPIMLTPEKNFFFSPFEAKERSIPKATNLKLILNVNERQILLPVVINPLSEGMSAVLRKLTSGPHLLQSASQAMIEEFNRFDWCPEAAVEIEGSSESQLQAFKACLSNCQDRFLFFQEKLVQIFVDNSGSDQLLPVYLLEEKRFVQTHSTIDKVLTNLQEVESKLTQAIEEINQTKRRLFNLKLSHTEYLSTLESVEKLKQEELKVKKEFSNYSQPKEDPESKVEAIISKSKEQHFEQYKSNMLSLYESSVLIKSRLKEEVHKEKELSREILSFSYELEQTQFDVATESAAEREKIEEKNQLESELAAVLSNFSKSLQKSTQVQKMNYHLYLCKICCKGLKEITLFPCLCTLICQNCYREQKKAKVSFCVFCSKEIEDYQVISYPY